MKPAPLGNIRRILQYLIFTVITTMSFIMTPNVDNNNNNVANAQTKQCANTKQYQ
jgi:hypothetical protein